MRRLAGERPKREPTIALINIVFLMLVFFMVAGTLAHPLEQGLTLVETRDLEGRAPPDALIMHPDGRLAYRGEPVADAATFYTRLDEAARDTIRIAPDRNAPAERLVHTGRELRALGAQRVLIVTERGVR